MLAMILTAPPAGRPRIESGPFRLLDNGKPAVDDWLVKRKQLIRGGTDRLPVPGETLATAVSTRNGPLSAITCHVIDGCLMKAIHCRVEVHLRQMGSRPMGRLFVAVKRDRRRRSAPDR